MAVAAGGCSFIAPDEDTLSADYCEPPCDPPEPEPALAYWLALEPGGYCMRSFKNVVPLCISDDALFSDPNGEGNFCFDDQRTGRGRLRRTYPDGIAIDLGTHYDGARRGHFLTLGSSDALLLTCDPNTPGRRIVIGVDETGTLYAEGPETDRLRSSATLSKGTHLLSYRVTRRAHALFLDGRLVAHGAGTHGVVVDFPERWSPGFVLGASNQRWWACSSPEASRWLRMAPFFVHLRDDPGDPLRFDLAYATAPGDTTVLLFDADGVQDNLWIPSHGPNSAEWTDQDRRLRAGRAFGAGWVDDVWAKCLGR